MIGVIPRAFRTYHRQNCKVRLGEVGLGFIGLDGLNVESWI